MELVFALAVIFTPIILLMILILLLVERYSEPKGDVRRIHYTWDKEKGDE